MAGLTDRDLRRIKRFVETPPRKRTPHILTPDGDEDGDGVDTDADVDAEMDVDVEVAG